MTFFSYDESDNSTCGADTCRAADCPGCGRYWISWYEQAQRDPVAAAVVRRYHQRPAVELYDVQNAPHELRNLAAERQHAPRIAELRERLAAWMREQGDRQTVFNEPRLLSDPAATRPGENSGTNTPR